MKTLSLLVLALLMSGGLMAADPVTHGEIAKLMKPTEELAAGMFKLTPSEQLFLLEWFYAHQFAETKTGKSTIVRSSSQLALLSDGTTLELSSRGLPSTWAPHCTVCLRPDPDQVRGPSWVRLFNLDAGEFTLVRQMK